MGTLASLSPDDSLWYAILVSEFYEDRLNTRLAEIDKIADNAEERILSWFFNVPSGWIVVVGAGVTLIFLLFVVLGF
jgi:hypothetical protein